MAAPIVPVGLEIVWAWNNKTMWLGIIYLLAVVAAIFVIWRPWENKKSG